MCNNFNWSQALWKEESRNVYVMGVEGIDGNKGSAVMAMIGRIKYASLGSLGVYNSWNVKIIPIDEGRSMLKNKLRVFGKLRSKWSGLKKGVDHVSFSTALKRVQAEQLAIMCEEENSEVD